MGHHLRIARRPAVLALVTAAVVVAGVGLAWFQPWKLWVDTTVNEVAPAGLAASSGAPARSVPAPGRSGSPTAGSGPVTLATGELISHEHTTTGTVRILRLADGSRILRLENLDTSNGPDLHVWITDAPVISSSAGWHVFDDGAHVNLGQLKGNKGNQNYPLPAGLDLGRYASVTIWCDRFNVSFGAAPLTRT